VPLSKKQRSGSINATGADATATRRLSRLPILLLVTAIVFLLSSAGIGWLAIRSVALQDLKSLANHIQVDAYRLNVLEWKAFADERVSPSLLRVQEALDRDIREDATQLVPEAGLPNVSFLFAAYDRDLQAELAALVLGHVRQARLIQRRSVVSFDRLADATNAASTFYGSAAARALLEGVTGSVLILLLGAVIVTSTNRRGQRALLWASARFDDQASHDALTGLPNRGLLTDRLQRLLLVKERTGADVGLLLMDLDRFKDVNETLGHDCGDALLIKVGERLQSALRDIDTVARLGGDEFAIVLPGVAGIEAALEVADRVRMALRESFEIEGLDLDVEASIGAVVSGRDGEDVLTLFRHADVAMYSAKKRGRSIAVYEQEADASSTERLTLLRDLRQALDSGDLAAHYQPKLNLETHAIVGVEALVRWKHPSLGMVPPDRFIPLAEHSGLIGPLTAHVLNDALAQSRRWIEAGTPLPVAVNLSARSLGDDRVLEGIRELLLAHGVPPDHLTLEITESAIITEPERANEMLIRLHEMGVRLSIDDFGTGYTSLAQLKTIPIDELKIDRSFVGAMTTDVRSAHIVRGVVALGHNLGLSIVAEGVEDEETLAALAEVSCDVAQGYLMARPMPAQDLDRWLSGHLADLEERIELEGLLGSPS
jgi:diguanylate cyclase (GGDEF)-like protein